MPSIRERLSRLKKLRHSSEIDFDIDVALEAFIITAQNIADIQLLQQNPGWQLLRTLCEDKIINLRKTNFALGSDPVKNNNKMIVNYSMTRMLERFLSIVDGVVNEEIYVEQEIEKLRKQKGTNYE